MSRHCPLSSLSSTACRRQWWWPQPALADCARRCAHRRTSQTFASGRISMKTFKSLYLQRFINDQRKLTRLFVVLCLGLALTLQAGRPANAQNTVNCAAPVTSAPTSPAIVSAASTSYGKVLVEGSAGFVGCSLYVLTSDELRTLTSDAEPFACSDSQNVLGAPCDTILWPALLTDGAPIAGPGVNPALLGTVTRTDVLSGKSVQQVTYADR